MGHNQLLGRVITMERLDKSPTHTHIKHNDKQYIVEQGLSGAWYCFRLEDDPTYEHWVQDTETVETTDGRKITIAKGGLRLDMTHELHNKRWIEKGKFTTREEAEACCDALMKE